LQQEGYTKKEIDLTIVHSQRYNGISIYSQPLYRASQKCVKKLEKSVIFAEKCEKAQFFPKVRKSEIFAQKCEKLQKSVIFQKYKKLQSFNKKSDKKRDFYRFFKAFICLYSFATCDWIYLYSQSETLIVF